jgi:hypothetical protein
MLPDIVLVMVHVKALGREAYHACREEVTRFDVVKQDITRNLTYRISKHVRSVHFRKSFFFLFTYPTVKTVLI